MLKLCHAWKLQILVHSTQQQNLTCLAWDASRHSLSDIARDWITAN